MIILIKDEKLTDSKKAQKYLIFPLKWLKQMLVFLGLNFFLESILQVSLLFSQNARKWGGMY